MSDKDEQLLLARWNRLVSLGLHVGITMWPADDASFGISIRVFNPLTGESIVKRPIDLADGIDVAEKEAVRAGWIEL